MASRTSTPGYHWAPWSSSATRRVSGALAPWMALLVCAASFLVCLGRLPLTSPNEGLYAQVAREMLHTGDWTVPRLDGTVYFEKPPLLYWSMALAMKIWGESSFAARLPSAIGGIITLVCVFALGRRLAGRAPVLIARTEAHR